MNKTCFLIYEFLMLISHHVFPAHHAFSPIVFLLIIIFICLHMSKDWDQAFNGSIWKDVNRQ